MLDQCGIDAVVLDVVVEEVVTAGIRAGYADATAVREALRSHSVTAAPTASSADEAVLLAAASTGALVTNDLALGRRARNLGIAWLRTADLVVLAVRARALDRDEGRAALTALHDAGRITAELTEHYLENLR